jgi:hypothetical protein
MNIIQRIRQGQTATCHVPRAQWAKLWGWCRARSEDGFVHVTELVGIDYEPQAIQRKRMGRAIPHIQVQSTYDTTSGGYRIFYSNVAWSFVR